MIKKYYEQFKWFLKYYKRRYIMAFLVMIIVKILMLMPPRIIGKVVDEIVGNTLTWSTLKFQVLSLIGLIVVIYFADFFWSYNLFRAADEISYLARDRIFKQLLKQGPDFYSRYTTGALMARATSDVNALSDLSAYGMMTAVDSTFWPILLFAFMLGISWQLTLASIVPLPFVIFFSKYVGEKLYKRYEEAQVAFEGLNQAVLEGVSGVRVVRAYNLEDKESERFKESADYLFKKNMQACLLTQLYSPVAQFFPGLAFLIAVGLGVVLITANKLSIGELTTFLFYLGFFIGPMFAIGQFINIGQRGSASMERIDELLNEPVKIDDSLITEDLPEEYSVEFRDFCFSYPGSDSEVLTGIKFSLKAGQTLGIVGPVGSGKSTIVEQLLHFYPLPESKIFLGGKDLAKIERKKLRSVISYAPQDNFLFSKSIRENILLGQSNELSREAAESKLQAVIEWADLEKDLAEMPAGLETEVGEKGIAISGGQKQRVCIARTLMEDSELLILDDCLSAVDAITEENILSALRQVRGGRTTLIVAHRLSAVRDADLIIVVQDGQITNSGSHQELIETSAWYREQYERQQLSEEVSREER
ncbi:MAG: ABC transporter transmembrane domain-containing protein [Eubacteriales bacterium]|nr:ABC transporter transmembrane domain-containing protein [Eubacteriales bacterium]